MTKDSKQKNKLILLGAGGHAVSSIDVIESTMNHEIIGLIDSKINKEINIHDYPLLGVDEDFLDIIKNLDPKLKGIVTVGQIKNSKIRLRLFNLLKDAGILSTAIISPASYVSRKANVDDGTIIFHGVVINANVRIGENCIINTNSLIEHDVVIGSHCHISTGAIINGDVVIENETFIGSGATIKQGVKIGSNCIIGMGQSIFTDIEAGSIISTGK
mgnify:CR=1 FL=1|jgi:sugar O-acyltransferase (sialic acid O-acetyltransferase NeuD family)|tara:strand:- start:496 stop:1143 length:648 start_codon:yes stop_codon:yes gene_type:complete